MPEPLVNLADYSAAQFSRGRPRLVEIFWRAISALLFQSTWFPFYGVKRWVLRCFGATVGVGVLIKPRVTITFPWRVKLGDHCWIGEGAWLDSLAVINIGAHACVSQGAYLCTGNHNYKRVSFDLITEPIEIGSGAWIGAQACVAPGVTVGPGAILTLGAVALKDLEPRGIYQGNPAVKIGAR